jgi:hypothetical protein
VPHANSDANLDASGKVTSGKDTSVVRMPLVRVHLDNLLPPHGQVSFDCCSAKLLTYLIAEFEFSRFLEVGGAVTNHAAGTGHRSWHALEPTAALPQAPSATRHYRTPLIL